MIQGSSLFRVSQSREIKPKKCRDTGKTGVYFSSNIFMALAIIVERKLIGEKFFLYVFSVDESIHLSKTENRGKYAFRELDEDLYYDGDELIPYDTVPEEHNVSHIDFDLFPILGQTFENELITMFKKTGYFSVPNVINEVFLDEEDFKKVSICRTFTFKYSQRLEDYLTYYFVSNLTQRRPQLNFMFILQSLGGKEVKKETEEFP